MTCLKSKLHHSKEDYVKYSLKIVNKKANLVCFKESQLREGVNLALTVLLLNVERVEFTSPKITSFNFYLH